jgi:hypothetical protein
MELVHGRSLNEVVRVDGPMGPEEACVVGIAVCRALAAVHGAKLVHRDIKAHNVMREDGGRVVLMDFGAGWELADRDRHRAVSLTGTPLYMAPELLAGGAPSVASDIYSLGVLLFFLVTGEHPLQGRTPTDVVLAHGLGQRRLLSDARPDLPDEFVRVVERALAASPERRYATAGAVIQALVEAIPGNVPARSELPGGRSPSDLGSDGAVIGGPATPRDRAPVEETGPSRSANVPPDSPASGEPEGRRTRTLLEAFQGPRQEQRRHRVVVAVVALAAVVAAGYAFQLRHRMGQQEVLAQQLFYEMKALDVQVATLELSAAASSPQGREEVRGYLERRRRMESSYEGFLASLDVRGGEVSEQERIILKITRQFGECDLATPPAYVGEVTRYIQRWRSSGSFERAVKLAQDKGYTQRIAREFRDQGLPPQFLYLALQESNFDPLAIGPQTSMGVAKGMWQFTPATAEKYGLTLGPLAAVRRPDPLDDRHDWQKATRAAVRYIKFLYSTDAQASGLLVIASYNWGEDKVIRLVRGMPANPRERNFWQFLEKYRERVTEETYDYVFSVVSAAVIGENPRLFGFPLDNPLAALDGRQAPSGNAN